MSEVPCNGCTLCCRGDAVRLLPGDNPRLYRLAPHPSIAGAVMLAHQTNGDCIYLDRAKGCTIHAHRPRMCREMDCRLIASGFSKKKAKALDRQGRLPLAIWSRGRELLSPKPSAITQPE